MIGGNHDVARQAIRRALFPLAYYHDNFMRTPVLVRTES
jgi:hypothetical protein